LSKKLLSAAAVLILGVLAVAAYLVVQGYMAAPGMLRTAYQHPLPLRVADLTPEQRHILLAVQDPTFYSHPGADFRPSEGVWTTITQILVRELYPRRYYPRFRFLGKIRQMLLAVGFNRRVPKDEQLRLYINEIDFGTIPGQPIYGFEAAAQVYFGKRFADLSHEEYLSLVATIVSPETLNPRDYPKENLDRVERIGRILRGECVPWYKGDEHYVDCFK
jgi:membrane carboxypeptidase/penicillin-binding protein